MATPTITNVFVLMLENHSFDNIFAMSGLSGIGQKATTADSNVYNNVTYNVQSTAPCSMPTDPGHEFLDTLQQLTGATTFSAGESYPAITRAGFASDYATSTTEETVEQELDPKAFPPLPVGAQIGDVLACFDTPQQLPVIHQLAQEFALCDQWYSALPGPTWPNRFFVHGASSAGLDDSPSKEDMLEWDTIDGFTYPNGSIYQAMDGKDIQWRLYIDENGPVGGNIAQVASLQGISLLWDINDVATLSDDLQGDYPYQYTFIEPNYGNILDNTYEGGSCQHPMDGMQRGEQLIKSVYEAIRAAPCWETSLLIITYDEHGGFYDSATPGKVTAPNDGSDSSDLNQHGFDFTQLGVRVPAVVVSPLIPAGTVTHTTHDHSSVLATVESLFGISPLTDRDREANDLLDLPWLSAARTDCPQQLVETAECSAPSVADSVQAQVQAQQKLALTMQEPLPEKGNLIGFLQILRKTDLELAKQQPATTLVGAAAGIAGKADMAKVGTFAETRPLTPLPQLQTRGDAKNYALDVLSRVQAARAHQVHSAATPAHTPATPTPA